MNARHITTTRIAEQARRFPDWLNDPADYSSLEPRDAALAAAIEHEVMRRWLTLEAVLQSQLSRPWNEVEFRLQAVLLVGAAQLLLLERLPDHAVINEAVEWAKQNVRPKAGGMVNAVLRKVAGLRQEVTSPINPRDFARDELPLHDGRVWKLTAPIFDERPLQRLAQQTSHPESLINSWQNAHGQAITGELARHSLVHPPTIIHGIESDDPSLTPHDEAGFLVFTGPRDSLSPFLATHSAAIVQDPTAARVANAIGELEPAPELIIDACAGMGTKTRQLAQVHRNASIIATDVSPQRVETLRQQFAGNPQVLVIEHSELPHYHSKADLLLLDVPCSNTGVLARRVEAKYRFSKKSQETITNLQRQIIADSLLLLSKRGRIAYSTCSIEAAENQQQAYWLTRWHPFRIAREHITLPRGLPGHPPTVYSDGGYYAIFERGRQ